MRFFRLPLLVLTLAILPVALLDVALPTRATAFEFSSLSQSTEPESPNSAGQLPYIVEMSGVEQGDLAALLSEASLLKRLQGKSPESGEDLVRRAEADIERLLDALWGAGHYAAQLRILIADEEISLRARNPDRAAARAEAFRARGAVPVRIIAEPGPLYRFASIRVMNQRGQVFDGARVPAYLFNALPGQPARSAALSESALAITAHLRDQGYPLARIADPEPVIDHPKRLVSVDLIVEEGTRARIGQVTISRHGDIDPAVIRSFIHLDDPLWYSPRALAETRRSISRIEAVGSVRIREAEQLAPDGTLPLDVEVTERPKRVLGGSFAVSNVDGPAGKAYWAHRNLFGGAERLRVEGDIFYLTNARRRFATRGGALHARNLGGRLAVGFVKPALAGSRFDFLFDATLSRNATRSYTTRLGNTVAALRYRIADRAFIQAGLEGEFGQTIDVLGRMNYSLVGLPISGAVDTTDNELDPREGFRLSGGVTPYLGFGDAARGLVSGRFQASGYRAFDEAGRFVIAGRVGVASISGGSVHQIPASRRHYAGGGGSVRGYEFRSLGPRNAAGQLIGGRSLFEASLELRIRITETIGIVPFLDVGTAFESPWPDFQNRLRMGAGIGLRYHTPIGPIRFDVASPLDRRKGEKPVAFYVSLGQSF